MICSEFPLRWDVHYHSLCSPGESFCKSWGCWVVYCFISSRPLCKTGGSNAFVRAGTGPGFLNQSSFALWGWTSSSVLSLPPAAAPAPPLTPGSSLAKEILYCDIMAFLQLAWIAWALRERVYARTIAKPVLAQHSGKKNCSQASVLSPPRHPLHSVAVHSGDVI